MATVGTRPLTLPDQITAPVKIDTPDIKPLTPVSKKPAELQPKDSVETGRPDQGVKDSQLGALCDSVAEEVHEQTAQLIAQGLSTLLPESLAQVVNPVLPTQSGKSRVEISAGTVISGTGLVNQVAEALPIAGLSEAVGSAKVTGLKVLAMGQDLRSAVSTLRSSESGKLDKALAVGTAVVSTAGGVESIAKTASVVSASAGILSNTLAAAAPGLSIASAALDIGNAVAICKSSEASGTKKTLAIATAALSSVSAAASCVPILGTPAAAVVGFVSSGLGFFRDFVT